MTSLATLRKLAPDGVTIQHDVACCRYVAMPPDGSTIDGVSCLDSYYGGGISKDDARRYLADSLASAEVSSLDDPRNSPTATRNVG